MKKNLLATTLLVATAGFAAADTGYNISGSGRFGVVNNGTDTTVETRLRFNIDAKTETDSGVTFGGRIRMQYQTGNINDYDSWADDYQGGARLSAAMLYMEAGGVRVEVGNANGAYDSAGLIWNSEIGLTDTSYGDPNNSYIGYFHSGPYQDWSDASPDAMGLFVSYSMGSFTARASYHTYDQYNNSGNTETSVSLDWSANGLSVSAAFIDSDWGGSTTYLGAAYAIGDSTTVGLNYFTGDSNDLITLYATHSMGNGLSLTGYVADQDTYDTAFGLGASYDLGGGAAIKASYEDRGTEDRSSLGVTFGF